MTFQCGLGSDEDQTLARAKAVSKNNFGSAANEPDAEAQERDRDDAQHGVSIELATQFDGLTAGVVVDQAHVQTLAMQCSMRSLLTAKLRIKSL